MTRSRESTVVVTVAIRGRPRDQRDLAEEVTPLERPHFAALALHLRLPVDEDEELPAERSFADELSPGAEVDLIGELRDLREFLLHAAREQWDALDRLNLRVPRERHAASHQSVTRDDDQQSPTTDSACKEFALMRIRPETSPSGPRWTALLELLQSTCYLGAARHRSHVPPSGVSEAVGSASRSAP